ncbi:MAG TPA: NADH-quinone oxidoreductase subunit F, partial [Bryobacterales bacterium]|nr:NADH-quinone oxidoreductase subunit F [Bryobacterales bacterium]
MTTAKRKARHLPKGRQADAKDRAELRSLLGSKPSLERTSLLEHLHLIQDVHGHLPARLLVALAEEMNLPLSEVFETVRFYAHFDYVEDGGKPPPPVTVRVCNSVPCAMAGSARLAEELQAMAGPHLRIVEAPCMGGCDNAPFAMAGRNRKGDASAKELLELVTAGRLNAVIPKYADFGAWMEQGGYRAFGRVRRGELSPENVISLIARSDLRGLGGAGFPAHVKWRAVLKADG